MNRNLRTPVNEYRFNQSNPDSNTNCQAISWTKKHCRITLIDTANMATTATLRIGDSRVFGKVIYKHFPLEGIVFENFSNIYHGQEIKREFFLEFGTGASVHVANISVEEWD